jgi:hypothetical protein
VWSQDAERGSADTADMHVTHTDERGHPRGRSAAFVVAGTVAVLAAGCAVDDTGARALPRHGAPTSEAGARPGTSVDGGAIKVSSLRRAEAPASPATSVDPGPYCRMVAGRARSFELDGDLHAAWDERRSVEFMALWTAPPAIRDAWVALSHWTSDVATPVVERAGYRPGSVPAEPAALGRARGRIDAFDQEICGAVTGST